MRGAAFILLGIAIQWITATQSIGRPMVGVVGDGMLRNALIAGIASILSVVSLVIGVAIVLISLWHHIGSK